MIGKRFRRIRKMWVVELGGGVSFKLEGVFSDISRFREVSR